MASHHGQGSVQIDGETAGTIDQYAGTRQENVLIYVTPLLARGLHHVTVTVTGTHKLASTGNVITIDRADSFDRDVSDPMTPSPCSDAVLEAGDPMLAVPSTTPLSLCVGNPCFCGFDRDGDAMPFNGVAGTTYRLQTRLEQWGGLTLYGPDGSVIADDFAEHDLLIDFTASSSGVYRLGIWNSGPVRTGGDYVLTITETAHRVSVAKSGSGSGTVTSQPAGISCGATCSASFAHDAPVTLTAKANGGSVFAGWGGACSGTSTTCTVSVNAVLSVNASFERRGRRSSATG